jgi:hypothetical protein
MSTLADIIDVHLQNLQMIEDGYPSRPSIIDFGKKENLIFSRDLKILKMPAYESIYCLASDGFPIRFPKELIPLKKRSIAVGVYIKGAERIFSVYHISQMQGIYSEHFQSINGINWYLITTKKA